MDRRLTDMIGVAKYEGDLPVFVEAARSGGDSVILKTHDQPEGEDAAIYVVRNGLVATDSYRHYRSRVEAREVSWQEMIEDSTVFGNWSRHLDAWSPLSRGRTLVVRYEDVVDRPQVVIGEVRSFLRREPVAAWVNPWSEAHAIGPNFFRRGLPSVPDTVTPEERAAFMALHGEWMERLAYTA
jgi:hypothetical protein